MSLLLLFGGEAGVVIAIPPAVIEFDAPAPTIEIVGSIEIPPAVLEFDAPTLELGEVAVAIPPAVLEFDAPPPTISQPGRALISWSQLAVPSLPAPVAGSHTYPVYRIAIHEIDGDEILESVPYIAGSLQYTETLNEPSTQVFSCSPDVIAWEDLSPGSREVRIYRNDVLVSAGDLLMGRYGDGGAVEFTGKGFARRLYRRLVSETQEFIEQDLITIAWALIEWANGISDTGITRDPDSTPLPPQPGDDMLRTMTFPWYEFNAIGEILDQFVTRAKGIDWEVTVGKTWKAYHHRKGVVLDPAVYAFEQGRNITTLTLDLDASRTTTKLWVIGFGSGEDTHYATAEDEDGTAQYGLLEQTYSRTPPGWVPFLQGVAERRLSSEFRDVRLQPTIDAIVEDPPFGSFYVGDTVQVVYDRGWVQVDDPFRIMSQTVRHGESGAELTKLVFDAHLVDIPEADDEPSEEP
jgi:hypothetical protein